MSKYIIKNCPCYDCSIEDWNCLGSDSTECKDGYCVLKQIVELCSFNYTKENTNLLAKEILKHLNIQEVE